MGHDNFYMAARAQAAFVPSNGFYGDSWTSKAKKAAGIRYTNSDLRTRGAVVGIYDQYDVLQELLALPTSYLAPSIKTIDGLPGCADMKKVASTDAGAQMKCAYWLAAAYRASRRTVSGREGAVLKANAESMAEKALADGVSSGSGLATAQITGFYSTARALLAQAKSTIESADVYTQIDNILKAGTVNGTVSIAVSQKTKAENEALAAQPGWQSYIPGLNAAENVSWGLKAAGAAVLLGGLVWLAHAHMRNNPQSEDYDEDNKDPMPPEAARQAERVREALYSPSRGTS